MSTFLSTIAGGLITIAATLLSFFLSNKSEKKKREQEEEKREAEYALAGYFKLFQHCNLLGNIGAHIDKSYEDSKEAGLETQEPFSTVGPPATKLIEPDRLQPHEYRFLMNKKDYELVEAIHLLEQRSINTHYLFKKYSEMHLSLQEWMENTPELERKMYGIIAKEKIPEDALPKYEMRAAQLNRVIGTVIEHISDDLKLANKTTQNFADKAHQKYPRDFPKLKVENSYLS